MGFLDWLDDIMPGGGTAWETDYLDAVQQAKDWIDQVADAKGWSDNCIQKAYAIVDSAQWEAGMQVDDTLTVAFWAELAKQWGTNSSCDGWSKLADVWGSASDASYDPIDQNIANVEETIGDIIDDTKSIVDPRKSPWPWVIGGIVGLVILRELKR